MVDPGWMDGMDPGRQKTAAEKLNENLFCQVSWR